MSNIAMKAALLSFTLFAFLTTAGCTRDPAEINLPIGRPVFDALGAPAGGATTAIDLASRAPGIAPWSARLEKKSGVWRIAARSDRPGDAGDLADGKLVDHLLEIVSTFTTEATAGNGNDASFGLNPYRLEIRLGEKARLFQLGDPTGTNEIFFRVGARGQAYVGRGALIAFLPTLRTPDDFVSKSPFLAAVEEFRSVRLEKLHTPDRGVWEFARAGNQWLAGKIPLNQEKTITVDRIFRQRLLRVLPESTLPELADPDWRLVVRGANGDETLAIAFPLNEVVAKNTGRIDRALALYPEMAGALRAFTQARFTPLKSGTK